MDASHVWSFALGTAERANSSLEKAEVEHSTLETAALATDGKGL